MALYLVTGGAGFIGSNLVRALIEQGHQVRVIDDFSTGKRSNLAGLDSTIDIIEADICDDEALGDAFLNIDYCLHQAAIPSVPRSLKTPRASNRANVDGSLALFLAARDANVKRVVCASSSSVYGPEAAIPTPETSPLAPGSPYAVSKAAAEMYARVCSELYGTDIVSLRYFNVFGPGQDPRSQYAAVIPLFIRSLLAGRPPRVHGDGRQSRDFCYIDNVVQANLLACEIERPVAGAYNVACGESVTILEMFEMLVQMLGVSAEPEFTDMRPGDIPRSLADIAKARETFGYTPAVMFREGLEMTVQWHRDHPSR